MLLVFDRATDGWLGVRFDGFIDLAEPFARRPAFRGSRAAPDGDIPGALDLVNGSNLQ
jgi:hypothetical protein